MKCYYNVFLIKVLLLHALWTVREAAGSPPAAGVVGAGAGTLSMDNAHESCGFVGSCIACSDSEIEKSYCSTGEKVRVLCIRNGVEHEHYQPCQPDASAGLFSVLAFMAVCAFLGAGAYLVVLARRRQSLSLFDRRRQQQQRPQQRGRGR